MVNPNTIILTHTFNTDGAAVFQSSKQAVRPIFIFINELPFKLRFWNTLAGLYVENNLIDIMAWCYAKEKCEEGCMRFLIEEQEPEDRSHDKYMQNMNEAIETFNV